MKTYNVLISRKGDEPIEFNSISEDAVELIRSIDLEKNGITAISVVPVPEFKFKPFDVVNYKPKNEVGIVKSVNSNGAFVLFRIQSTAALCKFDDLELE